MASSMVHVEHVTKTYPGGTQAVRDLSLEIPEGEIFTLVGPSGCGKTTTLRLIAGLEEPDAGVISFRDRRIVDIAQRIFVRANVRNVGMVFQSYAIWPHMTVEENVGYPLKLRGVSRGRIREQVAATLQLVGMAGMEKRPAPLLSGGQQQRVALARALVYEPDLLLLDEPFSNLDAKLRDQMRVEVKLLQHRLGITVVFVTHDQVEALSLSDHIAVMNLGELQQVGKPELLYQHPANPFVRDFLGKTILLRGLVSARGADGQVAVGVRGADDCVLFARGYDIRGFTPGQEVNVAIRPEDVELVAGEGIGTPTSAIGGTVEARLFMGERTEYRVAVPDQEPLLVYGRREQMVDEGGQVWLRPHGQNIAVWPA
ncbi:MAG: ATP-binding cassette domain-containing protein [Chloroflexi bacterium]|nr:ATP-binding cassette domain-containing protein [Chloroflexota bacterium]